MGRYGIGDTTQDHTGFTTNTVRDVALHQSIATAFRHRYHRPHFFSLSLSLSREAAAGIRCAEVKQLPHKRYRCFLIEKKKLKQKYLG
jgi:hypothetical protein